MTKNNLLSEKLSYIGASDTPTHLHLCSYNAEEVQSFQENNLEKIIPSLKEDHINWIQVHGLQNTEMVHQICRHFCIDFLTIQESSVATAVIFLPCSLLLCVHLFFNVRLSFLHSPILPRPELPWQHPS